MGNFLCQNSDGVYLCHTLLVKAWPMHLCGPHRSISLWPTRLCTEHDAGLFWVSPSRAGLDEKAMLSKAPPHLVPSGRQVEPARGRGIGVQGRTGVLLYCSPLSSPMIGFACTLSVSLPARPPCLWLHFLCLSSSVTLGLPGPFLTSRLWAPCQAVWPPPIQQVWLPLPATPLVPLCRVGRK